MALTEAEFDDAVQHVLELASSIGDDTKRLTQMESADFYDAVADDLKMRARTIRQEMEAEGVDDDV